MDAVKFVEKHETRQSAFLKQWPEAKVDKGGCLEVCPYIISNIHRNAQGFCAKTGVSCWTCRREFWSQEVK